MVSDLPYHPASLITVTSHSALEMPSMPVLLVEENVHIHFAIQIH